MAKNAFKQKKRIAHFQNAVDNFSEMGNDSELSGYRDYVSSIIGDMDSNINSLHSDCIKKHAKRRVSKTPQKDDNSISISSSRDFSPNPMGFKRKFSTSRKFPLMEKSQKIMKQLKHNRRIPKPRAHLAAFPNSSVSVNVTEKPQMSKKNIKLKDKSEKLPHMNKKNKKSKDDKSKLINSSTSHDSVSNNYTLNSQDVKSKNSKISNPKRVCKKGESTKSKNSSEDSENPNLYRSDVNTNIKKNSLSDANALKESENETTDSEYERFVKESKKGLPKKAVKKLKHSDVKRKVSRDKSKSRVRKKIKKKYDSGDDDDDSVPSSSDSTKMSSFKKRKITHKVPTEIDSEDVNDEPECDMLVNDISIKDSSPVCDTVNNETSVTDRNHLSDEEYVCIDLHEADSSWESDATMPDMSSLASKKNILEVLNNEIPDISSHFKDSSDVNKTELNDRTADFIDLCDSEDDDCKSSEDSTVSALLEQKCSAISGTTFGSHDSGHKELPLLATKEEKCKLMDAAQNNTHLDSEESDIEVIEVITDCSKNSDCKTDKPINMHNQFERTANYKENDIAIDVESTHSQVIVKAENLGVSRVYKTEHSIKNENSAAEDSKHDAVYMTNICSEFSQNKLINQRTSNSEYNKPLEMSSKDSLLNDDDDDIVILSPVKSLTEKPPGSASGISSGEKIKTEMPINFTDSLKHVKNSGHEFLKMDTEYSIFQSHVGIPKVINTKFENKHIYKDLENRYPVECVDSKIKNTPLTEKELKLYEGMCPNSKSLPLNSYGIVWKGKQDIDKIGLIKLYKKEILAYQAILKTGAGIGASLKMLETCQAEKVKHLQSLVHLCCLKTSDSSGATLTAKREPSTLERLAEDKPSVSSLINLVGGNDSIMSQMNQSYTKKELLQDLPSSGLSYLNNASKIDSDSKPIIDSSDELQNAQMLQPKSESSPEHQNLHQCQSDKKQALKLVNEECSVCGKEAMFACQGCEKVFFCAHECGMKFWNEGHAYECGK